VTTSSLPKRIMTLGMPSDYPPEFAEISAACDFAIAASPNGEVRVVKDRQGTVGRAPTLRELTSVEVVTPADVARILGYPAQGDGSADYAAPAPNGWQGTQPAEGTRRATILAAIKSSPDGVPMTPLDLADRIESALLRETIAEECDELPDEVRDCCEKALADDEFEDVSSDDFPAFEVIDDEGVIYVSLRSILGIFEHLRSILIDAEIEEEEAEEPRETVMAGHTHGKRETMIAALREDAATEADAEAAVSELERTGRAFLDGNGRHLPEAEPRQSGFRVEGSQLSPLARFLDFLGVR